MACLEERITDYIKFRTKLEYEVHTNTKYEYELQRKDTAFPETPGGPDK